MTAKEQIIPALLQSLQMKKVKTILFSIVCLMTACFVAVVLLNMRNDKYDKLPDADRQALLELETYMKAEQVTPVWQDFSLYDKTFVTINKSDKTVYLVNPEKEPKGIFVRRIKMPSDSGLSVYRISPVYPGLFQFWADGNFNTIQKEYRLYGNEVYYVKYDRETGIDQAYTSEHFITFLTHEAFHYYRQNDWPEAGRYPGEKITDSELKLLEKEYVLLDEIRTQMRKRIRDKEALYDLAEEYVAAAKALEAENPELAAHYAERETVEGSAEYVGIQASRIVGYDYGVMYFTNQTDVPFSTVVPNVEAGLVSRDFVADSIPYRTGATLCQLMDAMELTDWQERLNNREEATLLSVLESYLV